MTTALQHYKLNLTHTRELTKKIEMLVIVVVSILCNNRAVGRMAGLVQLRRLKIGGREGVWGGGFSVGNPRSLAQRKYFSF